MKDKLIGVIGAMKIETDELKEKVDVKEKVIVGGAEFIRGAIGNTEVVIAQCGIGKVFAAACTQAMIMRFRPDYIVNIGVCGAVSPELELCDIVIGEKTVQYDMDTSAIGDPVGLISGINKIYFECDESMNAVYEKVLKSKNIHYLKGVIATGDRFLHSSGTVDNLRDGFGAISGDMESAAIGQVCYINNTPYGILRGISDKGDENSGDDYEKSRDAAAHIVSEVMFEFLK